MQLVIFGSTGGTGRQVVQQALDQGHLVTAFARDPNKINIKHSNLRIVQGDVMDAISVEQAIRGQDAVVCVLGAGKQLKGTVRSEGTQQIIRAMQKVGVRRLICQSTLGAGDSWGSLNFFWKYVMFGFILRHVFADHEKQENEVRQSNLAWTIIRPGAFVDGDRTGNYRYGFPGTDKSSKLKISRADVADFILKLLANDTYIHKTPSVSY
jgi:putative NADH-flavin reductase